MPFFIIFCLIALQTASNAEIMFYPVFALVYIKMEPIAFANFYPYSFYTTLSSFKSDLLAIKAIIIFDGALVFTSYVHLLIF